MNSLAFVISSFVFDEENNFELLLVTVAADTDDVEISSTFVFLKNLKIDTKVKIGLK